MFRLSTARWGDGRGESKKQAGGQVNRQDVDKQGPFRLSRTPTNKKAGRWQVAGGR